MYKNIFQSNKHTNMSITEHLKELRQRLLFVLIFFFVSTTISGILLKKLTFILQLPAIGVKFLQLAPGEFFFVSIKIALYSGIILSCPFILYQITLFILPGLKSNEIKVIIPIIIGSILLFFFGLIFGYYIIAPTSLKFFINYGANVVEPIWSFEQYFNFILILLFSTALAFQIPILQLLLGLLNIISSQQMISVWKYVILTTTIIAAIITPSTDPLTQILLSLAIIILYIYGIGLLKLFHK
jgi:sec-independent protein translocase protein TatC|uniref:Sec-independent translocase component C n=1 Tax=Thorea hispida TaxID=202687 RepID=A0A1C9CAD1_9FLOR|nr:Sec-independent translocase component C [Thorea hispida]AOM65319.1 Sec-independent translocase component C [Thorea hispida]ARX95879.1 Sec-independent translocase component C' [Thorea hispida]UNJ79164.1 Sec-independent translocase component C [Thorea hispida]